MQEVITKLEWTVLPHPPYNPDLAPFPPQTRTKMQEAITKLEWTVLSHPPYSPDLAPFPPL
jgi:hypothetical protein